MISFIADENFNADIVRGLLRRDSTLDIVTVQQVGLSGADDPMVLEWAATNNRLVLTHDVQTASWIRLSSRPLTEAYVGSN